MRKMDRTLLYKIIAGVSFVVLCVTQLVHIRTMYNVESKNYNLDEKKKIQSAYEKSITNDKLFPGGSQIIDHFIYRHIDTLERHAQSGQELFSAYAKNIRDSMFAALKKANNLDSLLTVIRKDNKINTELEYALVLHNIDIAFKPNEYVPFYTGNRDTTPYAVPAVENFGVKIGGELEKVNTDNQISSLIVSAPTGHTYRIKFSLHGDSPDRLKHIILSILPTILVSIFSILAVLIILLFTLINWQKQKKISEAKSDFINTITHEFQTPLSAIIIANKTIENENQSLENEKLNFLTGVIRRQTERLNILTKQVADSSTDHDVALSLGDYKMNDLMDEVLSDYQMNLQGKNTEVFFTTKAGNDDVQLDKTHFFSIITNLLDNAVKYNHKPKKEIRITTFNSNNKTLTLSITDNGDGMDEKVRKNIFTRFYRDPSLTRTNEPGLGLGLFFTKKSIDAHRWKIEVKSKEGIGTEFLIHIPISDISSSPGNLN